MKRHNIEFLWGWFDALRRRDTESMGAALDPGVAWLGVRPDECYLAELYVVPERRGQGIGRALMEASMNVAREQGAAYMDLGTSEDDVAARALYEASSPKRHSAPTSVAPLRATAFR